MNKKKILVVDDEMNIRELLADFFASMKIGCDAVSNAKRALYLLSHNSYFLIFLDYNLEKEKAPDVVGRIRVNSGNAPVVLLTGSQDVEEGEIAKLGVADLIYKPFKFDRVMEVVNRYLESK
ncbi:MAG TPA: response regulator [Patescibacteria group bacterium]|nr:response regulator [Patescibacteria group bacterium]